MNNSKLTPKQQEIIESLKEQFSQINSSRPTISSNPLVNYENEFNKIKQSESKDRAIIDSCNEVIRKIRAQMISDNYYYLDELLDEISDNIILTKGEKSLKLSKGRKEIIIYYFIKCDKNKHFKYEESIEVLTNSIEIEYCCVKYENIFDVINSDKFKDSFQSMLMFN